MSTLFTAVSVEQQEIVAGGVVTFALAGAENNSFVDLAQVLGSESHVNKNGVYTRTVLANSNTESRSIRSIALTPFNF
jgi:hypothetical protein